MKVKFLVAAFIALFMISTKIYAEDYTVPVTTKAGETYTVTLHTDGKVTGIEATEGITVGEPVLVVSPTIEITGTFTKLYPDALKDATIERDEFRGIKFYYPQAMDWKKPGMISEGIYALPYVGSNDIQTWMIVNVFSVFTTSALPKTYNLNSIIYLVDGKRLSMDLTNFSEANLSQDGKTLTYSMSNLSSADVEQFRMIAAGKKVKVQVIFNDPAVTSSARTITKAEQQYIGQALSIYEMLGGK